MKNQIKKVVGVLMLIVVLFTSVMYNVYPAEAKYIYPYGVYKSIGEWAGFKLDYEYASGPDKDFITIYVKGEKSTPITSEVLKKVKGKVRQLHLKY